MYIMTNSTLDAPSLTRVVRNLEKAMKFALSDIKDDELRTKTVKSIFRALEEINAAGPTNK